MYVASPPSVYPHKENHALHSLALTSITDAKVMKEDPSNPGTMKLQYALHDDIVPDGGAQLKDTPWAKLRDHVNNPEKNPDFFRVGALLTHNAESNSQVGDVAAARQVAKTASNARAEVRKANEIAESARQVEVAKQAESVRLAREAKQATKDLSLIHI